MSLFKKKIVFSGGLGDFFLLILIFDPIMGIFKFLDPWGTTGFIDAGAYKKFRKFFYLLNLKLSKNQNQFQTGQI